MQLQNYLLILKSRRSIWRRENKARGEVGTVSGCEVWGCACVCRTVSRIRIRDPVCGVESATWKEAR